MAKILHIQLQLCKSYARICLGGGEKIITQLAQLFGLETTLNAEFV